jgi:hypothetical protein
MQTTMIRLASAGCVALVLAASSPQSGNKDQHASFQPTIPRPWAIRIGTTVVELVDFACDDPFLANGTKRELLVRFWYPASLTKGVR